MSKLRINYNDAYRVLGGVNDSDRIEYERIRRRVQAKIKLSAEEKRFVFSRCAAGRQLNEQVANDAFERIFSQSEGD